MIGLGAIDVGDNAEEGFLKGIEKMEVIFSRPGADINLLFHAGSRAMR